jgi:6-phosphofructokinase 1
MTHAEADSPSWSAAARTREINSVIGAGGGTIRAALSKASRSSASRMGFEWIHARRDPSTSDPLTIDGRQPHPLPRRLAHRHLARQPDHAASLENTVHLAAAARRAQLITIGGDDTAYSAMKLERKAAGRIRVVHVPKTIDNDLDLPPHVDTFGYQTARHSASRS